MKYKAITLAFFSTTAFLSAAGTQINVINNSTAILDNTGVALSAGVANANGDGDLFEIGYFTGSTATFTGTWVAITGSESNNPTLVTTIGDLFSQDGSTNVGNGLFSTQTIFDDSVVNTTNDLPANNSQLAFRFYDGSSRSGSMYNTVTSSAWTFASLDSPPPVTLYDFSDNQITLVWEDNSNPFRTSLVPEPSSIALLGLGGLAVMLRRRR